MTEIATPVTRPARDAVPVAETWDLAGLYPDTTAWEADLARVDALLPGIAHYKGCLGNGPDQLLACLRQRDDIFQLAYHVEWFASNRLSEDQADPARQALDDRASALSARAGAAVAYIEPEILALPAGTVEAYLDGEPELAVYRLYLEDTLAERDHTLGQEAEGALAALAEVLGAPYDIYKNTANADVAFDPVTDEHGREVPMSLSALNKLQQSPDHAVRRASYESALRAFDAHKRTLAAAFAAAQKRDVALSRLRRYPSALAAALAPVHLPESLFHTLVEVAEEGAEPFRRYMELRRRELGLDTLAPYDLFAPLDPALDMDITFDDAFAMVLAALAPLGDEYRAILEEARRARWVDWADNSGKRSGAYSSSCYGYHPVILLNWQGTVDDAFTLAHELGHAVHSTLTTRAQPYIYARYSTFLAEMASTSNEILLARYLLATTDDRATRRYVLTRALRSFTSNFYLGSYQAALQLEVHRMVERGEPLTYESVTSAYTAILKRWYGDTVDVTPDGMGSAWMRPVHHYLNFYSYQYATGISVAAAFANAVLTEGAPAVDRYLRFLSAGASAHAIDVLREAGVDLDTAEPIRQAVALFSELVDELAGTT